MENLTLKPVTILGAGSWGTAIALYLARRGQTVRLWSFEISEIAALIAERSNNQFMPGYPFPETIQPTANLAEALKNIEDVIIAVPSVGYRDTLAMMKALIDPKTRLICVTKGLDAESGQLLHEVATDMLGKDRPYAVISGPSFAREVAAGMPTSVMVASKNTALRNEVIQRFNSPIFRTYPSEDVVGTEIGGVAKNVIAIATGICDGLELGANARSALITRGLNEIITLGVALGGKMETFTGLAGLGDLILTCGDNQSRNRRLGLALGKGNSLEAAEKEIGQVVEGKNSAELVEKLANKHSINMPVCRTVCQILTGKVNTKQIFMEMITSNNSSLINA
ncbi:MAG TPA: NAD(P)H-dependent glycerol-3-phosphate dehydrogenase [Gammaproteobacteria bacterium]|jgi:glycerol-3-phosphate dehydrogenase (NAD(P)+)|nr:NAD(P)H-dependent glycerol-3-phosphate dehydrogenase [Gammaproteobacteria bacterium]